MDSRKELHNSLQNSIEDSKLELEKLEDDLAIAKIKTELLEAGIYRNFDTEVESLVNEVNSILE